MGLLLKLGGGPEKFGGPENGGLPIIGGGALPPGGPGNGPPLVGGPENWVLISSSPTNTLVKQTKGLIFHFKSL